MRISEHAQCEGDVTRIINSRDRVTSRRVFYGIRLSTRILMASNTAVTEEGEPDGRSISKTARSIARVTHCLL